MAVVRPKAPTASSEEPIAQIIGMPVENSRPGTIRKPPPIPKNPDSAPTPRAAGAAGSGLRVAGFDSWQTLPVGAGDAAPADGASLSFRRSIKRPVTIIRIA